MSLRDHLSELRGRLIKAMLFVAVGAVIGWILYPQILDLLKEPYCQLPPDRRFNPSNGSECQLAFFGPLDGFVLRLKVGVICGVILSSPFWLYQLWAFVTPGLRRHERRWTTLFVFSATLLFLAGAVLSYFTIGKALTLLVNLAGSGTVAVIAVPNYIGFVTSMLLVFGAAFELPLLISMLNLVGVLPAARLIKWQRIADLPDLRLRRGGDAEPGPDQHVHARDPDEHAVRAVGPAGLAARPPQGPPGGRVRLRRTDRRRDLPARREHPARRRAHLARPTPPLTGG